MKRMLSAKPYLLVFQDCFFVAFDLINVCKKTTFYMWQRIVQKFMVRFWRVGMNN